MNIKYVIIGYVGAILAMVLIAMDQSQLLTFQIAALVASAFIIISFAILDLVAPHNVIPSATPEPELVGVSTK